MGTMRSPKTEMEWTYKQKLLLLIETMQNYADEEYVDLPAIFEVLTGAPKHEVESAINECRADGIIEWREF